MKIKADLHMHTALSPCGSLDMSPTALVQQVKQCGLDVIAITDHNAMENSFYVATAAQKINLKVIYGMEAQTSEDVHILCYFQEKNQAEMFYTDIYSYLPDLPNNPEYFGDQVVVDLEDNIVRVEERLLLNALSLAIGEVAEKVWQHDGFVVPAHIDSPNFGLMTNLGFVPEELADCVMEISYNAGLAEFFQKYPALQARPWITNSDAHYLPDIGRAYGIYDIDETKILPAAIFDAVKQNRFELFRRKITNQETQKNR